MGLDTDLMAPFMNGHRQITLWILKPGPGFGDEHCLCLKGKKMEIQHKAGKSRILQIDAIALAAIFPGAATGGAVYCHVLLDGRHHYKIAIIYVFSIL